MVSEKHTPRIFDGLLFPHIFKAFGMARQPSKLIVAFLALSILCLCGWLMDLSGTVVATRSDTQGTTTELQVYMTDPGQVEAYIAQFKVDGQRRGVLSSLSRVASAKFHEALEALFAMDTHGFAASVGGFFRAVTWAIKYHLVYCITFLLVGLVTLSTAGGAICRIAALQFAQGEKPGLSEALTFSMRKAQTVLAIPFAPLGIILLLALPTLLLGLLGNIPWVGELIICLFLFLALAAGALIALVLIGTVAGFNLMFPAVAYDGLDCLDAISCSFRYVCQRPWRVGFYTVVAAAYGAVCYVFVRLCAFLTLWVTHWLLRLCIWAKSDGTINKLAAIWPEPSFGRLMGVAGPLPTGSWAETLAAFLIRLFLLAVVGLVVSYMISFYFSANTIIYALIRNRVDSIALADVYRHADETTGESTSADVKAEDTQAQQ